MNIYALFLLNATAPFSSLRVCDPQKAVIPDADFYFYVRDRFQFAVISQSKSRELCVRE